jgi:hypothetical protein
MHFHFDRCRQSSAIRSHDAAKRIAGLSYFRALCVVSGLFFAADHATAEVLSWEFEATVSEIDNLDMAYGDVRLGDTMRGTFRYDLSIQPDSRSTPGKSFYGHPASFEGVHVEIENPRTGATLEWLPDTSNPADAYDVRVETKTSSLNGGDVALLQTMKLTDHPASFWLVIEFESSKELQDASLPSYYNLDDWALAGVYMTDLQYFNGLAAQIYSLRPLAEPAVPGDFDADGDADAGDYELWRATFGSTERLDADANGNGSVEAADYVVWRHSTNQSTATATQAVHSPVPEPPYLHLLAIAVVAMTPSVRAGALAGRRHRLRLHTGIAKPPHPFVADIRSPKSAHRSYISALVGTMVVTSCFQHAASAAVVADKGDAFWWVTDHELGAPNNDDLMGEFTDNPNKLSVNSFSEPDRERQPIDALERIVPTVASGSITEYAMTLGGNEPARTPGTDFLLRLDNLYIMELGFGTGDSFVPARLAAPLLRFDSPELVSPAIENYKPIPPANRPLLELVQHRGDSLLLQGRHNLGNFRIASFATDSLFVLPLDIPDLPLSARSYYNEAELTGLSESEIPFTIRMHIVPEPGTIALALLGLAGTLLVAANKHHVR